MTMNINKLTQHIETQDDWILYEKQLLKSGAHAYFLICKSNHPFINNIWWRIINDYITLSETKHLTLEIKMPGVETNVINTLFMILLLETADRYPNTYELDYIKKIIEFPNYFNLKMLKEYAYDNHKSYLAMKLEELNDEIEKQEIVWNEPNPWIEFSLV